VQGTRSLLRRYASEFENRVKTDSRVGVVIDGEACEIYSVFIAVHFCCWMINKIIGLWEPSMWQRVSAWEKTPEHLWWWDVLEAIVARNLSIFLIWILVYTWKWIILVHKADPCLPKNCCCQKLRGKCLLIPPVAYNKNISDAVPHYYDIVFL